MAELNDVLQQQYDAILNEIQPFIDSDLYHQGISRLNTILEGVPEDDEHRLFRAALFAKRAELNLELEDDEAAWDDAQKAMNGGWYDATVYSIAGWAMYHMEKLDLALEQFGRAVDVDPEHESSLMGRAMVYFDQEEYDMARTDLSRVVQVNAENANALATRAEVSVYLGAIDSARKDVERARAIDEADPDYALLHARLLLAEQEFDDAIKALDASIGDEDPLLEAILLRSHLHFMKNDLKKARRDAVRASNTFPDEAIAFVQLAMVQFAMQSNTLALKAADRAVTLDGSLSDGFYIRSLVHAAEGREEEAALDDEAAQKAPLELPVFLYGPLVDRIDPNQLVGSLQQFAPGAQADDEGVNPFPGGIPPIPGLGGLDPTKMLDQVFDSDGNVRPAFKPILRMALKNAPSMMKTVPDSMLKKMGNIDKEQLENFDMSQLSEEEIEQQMKLFYKMVKAGKNPLDPDQ